MPERAIQRDFNLARQHQQAGRLQHAIALYQKIIARKPQHGDAFSQLGLIAYQMGRNDAAVVLMRHGLAIQPKSAEAWSNLGHVLKQSGKLDAAIEALRQAVALRPDLAIIHSNLGNALLAKGQLDDAIECYRTALTLKGGFPEAYYNLGNAMKEKGDLAAAIDAYRRSISLDPNIADVHSNLGNALKEARQFDEAIVAYRRAIALKPDFAEAHSNLGDALRECGQVPAAIAANLHAIALKPDYAEAHANLGVALYDNGQAPEAVAACARAIELKPNCINAHWNLALALLVQGDFRRGWEEYEWRLKPDEKGRSRRESAQPRWDGSPLNGRSILLHSEQGFGDTIQFIRYAPNVVRLGGKVIVECQQPLQRLFRSISGIGQVDFISIGDPEPAFDVYCPLMSLPHAFATTLTSIPATVPYLYAESAMIESWRQKLAGSAAALKVGLVWAGSPDFRRDQIRSIPLTRFNPLAGMDAVTFYSLQKGDAAREAHTPSSVLRLTDLTADIDDYADTAAFIANLDLVITVDTSVAHLAGAMGKQVWTLLPLACDWRWLLDRADSPWYPTMRLFRQRAAGDWDDVMARVAGELAKLKTTR